MEGGSARLRRRCQTKAAADHVLMMVPRTSLRLELWKADRPEAVTTYGTRICDPEEHPWVNEWAQACAV